MNATEYAKTDSRMRLILGQSARTGLPANFRDDLDHDAETLGRYPDIARWVLVLRENGTHLYPIHNETPSESAYYREAIVYRAQCDNTARFYLLDREIITPVTAMDACRAIRCNQD